MPIKPRLADPNAAAHERLYKALRQQVMHGEMAPGQALTLRLFARNHGLTPAEEMVLAEACKGVGADDIAGQLEVGVATVRTQLASIRRKTHCGNLRQLFRQLAVLPPLVSAIRAG